MDFEVGDWKDSRWGVILSNNAIGSDTTRGQDTSLRPASLHIRQYEEAASFDRRKDIPICRTLSATST